MKLIVASLFAVALSVPAWSQEKDGAGAKQEEKKAPAKEGGEPVKKPVKEAGEGPTLGVEEVDVNGDGRISAAELKAVFERVGLTREMFEAPPFTRLRELKFLRETRQIDDALYWTRMPVPEASRTEAAT